MMHIQGWAATQRMGYFGIASFSLQNCPKSNTKGDYENELEPDEALERIALENFRTNLKPRAVTSPFADHFLATNDTSTIFLPTFFEKPIAFYEVDIASLAAANKALEAFAQAIGFNLLSNLDDDSINDKWIPLATAKNVARTIYQFFTTNPNSCVVFS